MRENRLRALLGQGRPVIGQLLMEFGTRGFPAILDRAGLDYAVIDMRHSGFGLERVADLLSWFKATEVTPLVTIHKDSQHLIGQLLDVGAMGIQVTHIDSVAQARAIVHAAKYPPLGERPLTVTGLHSDYRPQKPAEYMAQANRQTMLCAVIESKEAVALSGEIAALEGIDILTIGHNDLADSLGLHGQFQHPEFKAAIKRVIDSARAHGKHGRIVPQNDAELDEYYALGYRVLGVGGSDASFYRDALKATSDRVRSRLGASKDS